MATVEDRVEGELAEPLDKLAVRSAQVEQKDPEEEDVDMGEDDASSSDDEDAVDENGEPLFAEEVYEAIDEPPTEEQQQQIKELIDSAQDDAALASAEEYTPNMELGIDGTTITFSCKLKQILKAEAQLSPSKLKPGQVQELKQSEEKESEEDDEAAAEPEFESDTFIKYIFIRDKDEKMVAAKTLKQSDEPVAVFEVGDEWYKITPYSLTNKGFLCKGEELELEDDNDVFPFPVDEEGYVDITDVALEIDEFLKEKEPEEEELDGSDAARFRVSKEDGCVKVEMDVPSIQLWVRDAAGKLIGCRQYEEPQFDAEDTKEVGKEDEPPKKKRKISYSGATAQWKIADDVTKVRVFAYTVDEDDMACLAAEMEL